MKQELISQYRAGLAMLANTIDKCPDTRWADNHHPSPFWQVVYHALHFTALYTSTDEAAFTPWRDHLPGIHQLGRWGDKMEMREFMYTREAMNNYLDAISASIPDKMAGQNMEEPSGFDWLPMNKLELHLYNIRHLQHHTGQLVERLHQYGIYGINWVRG